MSGRGSTDRVAPCSGTEAGARDPDGPEEPAPNPDGSARNPEEPASNRDEPTADPDEPALDPVAAAMVADGRAARLVTRGRRTGRPVTVAVGFVEEPDGSLLVAAGRPDADWALNLLAEPGCRVAIADRTFDAEAEPLEGAEAGRAIRELILRYGTPAERLGSGPAFRLWPRIPGAPSPPAGSVS